VKNALKGDKYKVQIEYPIKGGVKESSQVIFLIED
jgi:hypothetical protein